MGKEIIIVDKNDNIVGYKDFSDMKKEDIYRVSALWLTNSKGEVLLAKRAYNKKHHPGKWGPAVAGTIEKGETYGSNIKKEAKEEIGLDGIEFIKGPKTFYNNDFFHFTQWYTVVVDRGIDDFFIDNNEVAEIKWFSKKEINKKIEEDPEFFLPNLPSYFELFK
ncbi:MAG: NUDIX domain-containing protein [Patescibacteria group bacterium]